MLRGLLEDVTHEFVFAFPALPPMSFLSYLDGFRDKSSVTTQLLFRGVLLPGFVPKSWRQHPTRLQLYGHLPPITKTIQVRRTRHAGHCWRSKDELISDVLLWTPTHGCARVGRPARTYIQQLCEDTGCSPEDLPEAMNDRKKWRETVRDIRAGGATWWWWNEVMKKKQRGFNFYTATMKVICKSKL